MSRLRIFLLFTALVALTSAFAACGSSGGSSASPQQVIDDATLQGIESGNVDFSLSVNVPGDEGGNVDVSASGPFQSEGKGQLPQFDLTAKANGSINDKSVDFEGGLELLGETAFVNYEGTDYEVDPTTFNFVKSAVEQSQSNGSQGNSSEAVACQEAAGDLKVADFVDNLTNEGSADVGGASTTKISGDLNVSGAIDSLTKLTEDPACSAQLSAAGPLPSAAEIESAQGKVSNALKTAHVDVYVGDDNIVRRISAELTIEPPSESGSGPEKVNLSFDLSLNDVNQDQTISAPDGAKPLSDLFLKLGINPIELLEAGSSGGLGGLGGAGGLGGLLNGLGGGATGGSGGSGGESSVPGVPSGNSASQQAYLKCLGGAETPADLQHCATLLK